MQTIYLTGGRKKKQQPTIVSLNYTSAQYTRESFPRTLTKKVGIH